MHQQIPVFVLFIIIVLYTSAHAEYALNSNETQPVYTLDDIYDENKEVIDDKYFERCYGFYGCFPVEFPWKSEQRAHSVYPFSPSVIKIQFPLFTNSTRRSPMFLDINNLSASISTNINTKFPKIYLIIHGFLELGSSPWLIKMMNEILDYDNSATVVIVDWRSGSSPPYYQAVANTRVVGAIVAHMVMGLALEIGVEDLDRFHLIGHSLGSHISGYAGYYVQRDFNLKIGRITGLDPAKPYFEFTPPIVRLDITDATFVDIIHTDSATFQEKSFGLKQPIGHVDFYPNGGRDQPVCDQSELNCNHKNSVELFTESINTKCQFLAISCDSYELFLAGSCTKCNQNGSYCLKFGFHSKRSFNQFTNPQDVSYKSFYLFTSQKDPFCQIHYKIVIKMAELTVHKGDVGTLSLRLISSDGRKSDKIEMVKSQMDFNAGKEYNFLVSSNDIGKDIISVRVLYSYKLSLLRLKNPEIFVEYINVESMEYGIRTKMCSENRQPLLNGFVRELKNEYCEKSMD